MLFLFLSLPFSLTLSLLLPLTHSPEGDRARHQPTDRTDATRPVISISTMFFFSNGPFNDRLYYTVHRVGYCTRAAAVACPIRTVKPYIYNIIYARRTHTVAVASNIIIIIHYYSRRPPPRDLHLGRKAAAASASERALMTRTDAARGAYRVARRATGGMQTPSAPPRPDDVPHAPRRVCIRSVSIIIITRGSSCTAVIYYFVRACACASTRCTRNTWRRAHTTVM